MCFILHLMIEILISMKNMKQENAASGEETAFSLYVRICNELRL